MTIVGNGLIGKYLQQTDAVTLAQTIFFASGVANSKEIRPSEFARESSLLDKYSQNSSLLVYFSTCSIYDSTVENTLYIRHKVSIEKRLMQRPNTLVLRLPQVVGFGSNPNTLIENIYRKIKSGEHFEIWCQASRSLLDIKDVAWGAINLANICRGKTMAINLAAPRTILIPEIVSILEECVGTKANASMTRKGAHYAIDCTDLINMIGEDYYSRFSGDYFESVIRNYYSDESLGFRDN